MNRKGVEERGKTVEDRAFIVKINPFAAWKLFKKIRKKLRRKRP